MVGHSMKTEYSQHSTSIVTTIVQDSTALKKFHDERISAIAETLQANPNVCSVMVVHAKAEPNAIYLQSTIHWSEEEFDTDDGE